MSKPGPPHSSGSSAKAKVRLSLTCTCAKWPGVTDSPNISARSEEHTSELQSQSNLVCRLLLEKKKKTSHIHPERARATPWAANVLSPLPPTRLGSFTRDSAHSIRPTCMPNDSQRRAIGMIHQT